MKKVTLSTYKDSWKQDFELIATTLKESLKNSCLRIDHIGSTAIGKIQAKDIIDLQIVVKDFNTLPSIHTSLDELGFDFIDNIKQDHVPFCDFEKFDPKWEKRFFTGTLYQNKINIHIRSHSNENWKFALMFRDYLNVQSDARKAYEQVKVRLIESNINTSMYTYVKDPVCDLIYLLAKRWAQDSHWQA